jgi:hypothetical protein
MPPLDEVESMSMVDFNFTLLESYLLFLHK